MSYLLAVLEGEITSLKLGCGEFKFDKFLFLPKEHFFLAELIICMCAF